ncbi:hypothetical protein B0H16DRAFT_1625678 [Mycena metata]|uniref:Uncharacterized protein n=1 Tax=Mycena metata TaxID=1033252 RepID=A0AAD7H554_9AGAR|nr:hypothetical protein B0H16DRAFT_1625678 [Mycena metata]
MLVARCSAWSLQPLLCVARAWTDISLGSRVRKRRPPDRPPSPSLLLPPPPAPPLPPPSSAAHTDLAIAQDRSSRLRKKLRKISETVTSLNPPH